MSQRILIIDDDLGLLVLLRQWLELEGFQVTTAKSGESGLRKARQLSLDLIILDIMMPDMDGWVVYQQLRQASNARIMVLTALATKEDIARGVELGVDDFLVKPCGFDELRLRIRRALGHSHDGVEDRFVVFDDGYLRVDLMHGASVSGHEPVDLTPTESRLLLYLARRRGQTVPSTELLVNVWGPEYEEEHRYLDLYVRHLSRKIESDPGRPRYIRTSRDRGYCFADVVTPVPSR
ncbi:MAG: response regulator transcription factor [Anaerolineae bacterium]|nr:response regulator transcription factor [Anaerolineae bacterium]